MRIVFMGSSEASAVCLRAIMRDASLHVAGVVTQPDRPAGRGKALTPCPCKAFAARAGITEIISPENVNSPEAMERIRAWKPDVVAVVAFGQFLKQPLLDLPPLGCVNCHFSLLPKYRGASPVVAALAAGEKLTGVSVMRMGPGMDDGPVLLQSFEPIYSDATGGELMEGLAITGGVALAKALRLLGENALPPPAIQDDSKATYAPKLKKTDGEIHWDEPALAIERKIRAYYPWPGCYTFLPERFKKKGNTGRVAILRASFAGTMQPGWSEAAPGTVLKCITSVQKNAADKRTGIVVKCGDTALVLTEFKPEGGGRMDGAAFLAGRRLAEFTDTLGAAGAN